MELEFYWADYKRFGSDGTLMTLAAFLEQHLEQNYGPDIRRIFICGHCRALTPPNDNLSSVFEKFENGRRLLQESPSISLKKKSHELEIRFYTTWPVAEEFQPDDESLKLGTFIRFYRKLLTLLEAANEKLGKKVDFDFEMLISDIRDIEPSLPNSLKDLAAMYVKYQK